MVTFYHKGGEDSEWAPTGTGSVITTAGQFRAGIARCGLSLPGISGVTNSAGTWVNRVAFVASTFWTTMRVFSPNSSSSGFSGPSSNLWEARSASGVIKLRARITNGAGVDTATLVVEKLTNAGVVTVLGSSFSFSNPKLSGTKVDVFCNYNASGSLQFYLNNALVFSVTATDITTDSDTTLSYVGWGQVFNTVLTWSEGITSDTDTRTWGLVTQAPVANGNTHNWDTGSPAAANVNQTTTTFLTMDGSTTAGQIDQYTCPANPGGIFGVVCYSIHALAQKGTAGPSKVNLGPRTGGSDFFATNPDISLGVSFNTVVSDYFTNPNTGNPWQTTEIGNASGFNIGAKSIT